MIRFILQVLLMAFMILGMFAVVNALIWVGTLFPIPSTILSLFVVVGGILLLTDALLKGK